MGREVRRVPKGWEHPKDEDGQYIPLHNENYADAAARWNEEYLAWESGTDPLRARNEKDFPSRRHYYWEHADNPPDVDYYRGPEVAFDDNEATCYQVYETVTEGTPVSPVFETKEQVIEWLVAKGYSRFAAERFVQDGWAPTMMIADGVLYNDIESAALPRKGEEESSG